MRQFDLECLVELIETCEQDMFTVVVKNDDMVMPELVQFYKPDFKYKANYYKNAYNSDLTLKATDKIKIIDWYTM